MRMLKLENGKIVIDGDEALLAKIKGQDLTGVDISDFRINADEISRLFNLAESCRNSYVYETGVQDPKLLKTHDNIQRYSVLKQANLDKFIAN